MGSDAENDRQGSVFKDPARIERDLVAHRNLEDLMASTRVNKQKYIYIYITVYIYIYIA